MAIINAPYSVGETIASLRGWDNIFDFFKSHNTN